VFRSGGVTGGVGREPSTHECPHSSGSGLQLRHRESHPDGDSVLLLSRIRYRCSGQNPYPAVRRGDTKECLQFLFVLRQSRVTAGLVEEPHFFEAFREVRVRHEVQSVTRQ